MARRDRLRAPSVLILSALAGLAVGCTGGPKSAPPPEPEAVEPQAHAEDQGDELLARLKPEHFRELPPDRPTSRIEGDPSIQRRNSRPAKTTPSVAEAPAPAESAPAIPVAAAKPTPTESPARRRERLLGELADAIASDAASDDPFRAASALTVMQALEPGVASERLANLRAGLSPDQQRALSALSRVLAAAPDAARASPADLGRVLSDQAAALVEREGLTIATAQLARRVEGFGRYTPFEQASFLAGRPQTVIVYTELEGFAYAPVTNADPEAGAAPRWAVDLSQELQLFHDADGTLAWRSPAQASRDVSARQRRDHFLVQRVDLPRSLTVGSYKLKVTVRDLTSGATAERLIPLRVVADSALADR